MRVEPLLVFLIILLVSVGGWMLFKVYGIAVPGSSAKDPSEPAGLPRTFPHAMTKLLEDQLRNVPEAAMRFALQSRIDAAIRMEDTGRSLALLEVFFDLERLDIQPLKPEVVAGLDDGSHPIVALLKQPPELRESILARQLTNQLFRELTKVVGAKQAGIGLSERRSAAHAGRRLGAVVPRRRGARLVQAHHGPGRHRHRLGQHLADDRIGCQGNRADRSARLFSGPAVDACPPTA
jgi:hypothetical protein